MNKNFMVDTANITIRAGKGGDGKVSFKRERYMPKGGPDGGNGGDGGSVYLIADENMSTLMDFRGRDLYDAEVGQAGMSKKMHGHRGEDLILRFPVGTLVFAIQDDREILIGDLDSHGKKILGGSGGLGGKGNDRFKSSTNQTPMQFTPGTKGEEKELRLEVKMIADVGLVGFPNAGKSTLVNHLAGTKAKVASYPFTTLNPNLGVCELKNGSSIVIADLPGLIEGASQGKGLGDAFLRHVERTRILVHLVEPSLEIEDAKQMAEEAWGKYEVIRKELEEYSEVLIDKREIAVINKLDITEINDNFSQIKKLFSKRGVEVFGISAATGEGLEDLKNRIMIHLDSSPKESAFKVRKTVKVYTINDLSNRRLVFNKVQTIEKHLK